MTLVKKAKASKTVLITDRFEELLSVETQVSRLPLEESVHQQQVYACVADTMQVCTCAADTMQAYACAADTMPPLAMAEKYRWPPESKH